MAKKDDCSDYGLKPTSLKWCAARSNMPGIKRRVYFIPSRDIVKWPTLASKSETAGDPKLVTYEGKFTLAEGAKWQYLDVLTKKSSVECVPQGEKPSKSYLNKATFLHPGTAQEATAFARTALNDSYVYVFVVANSGEMRVIGNDSFDTETNVTVRTGAEGSSDAGTTIEVEVTDFCPAPFYSSDLQLEGETVSPSPGGVGA